MTWCNGSDNEQRRLPRSPRQAVIQSDETRLDPTKPTPAAAVTSSQHGGSERLGGWAQGLLSDTLGNPGASSAVGTLSSQKLSPPVHFPHNLWGTSSPPFICKWKWRR
jgi:hypothetical protein